MHIKLANFIFCLIMLFLSFNVNGQNASDNNTPKLNSPYSKIGLGDIYSDYNPYTAGMGGLSVGMFDEAHTNIENPASLGTLTNTVFDVSIYGRIGEFSGNAAAQKFDNLGGNISYMNLAFPLFNTLNEVLDQKEKPLRWGMSIGLVPYSIQGFNIASSFTRDDTGTIQGERNGRGGTYKLVWNNGFKYKKFNFGLGLGYFFGKKIEEGFYQNVDDDFFSDVYIENNRSYGGVTWRLGASYKIDIPSKKETKHPQSLMLSTYFNGRNKLTIKDDNLLMSSHFINQLRDTTLNQIEVKSTEYLPQTFGFGVTYEMLNKLKIGVEYINTQWSNANSGRSEEAFKDTNRFALGMEYIPNIYSFNNYFSKIHYRIGFYNETDPRVTVDQLKTTAVTVGFGFPIILARQQMSFVNLSFAYGKSGIANELEENFFKTTLGFSLNDNTWFFKRKFD